MIAVDQDPLGAEGTRVRKGGPLEVWTKKLQGGGAAIVLFNRGDTPAKIGVSWLEAGLL